MPKLLREPLLQFWLIGACIYGVYGLYGEPAEDALDATVVVDEARVEAFASQWSKRWNRPPTRQELDGVIDTFVREEILYRQAVAMGLHEDDPVTRRRVAQKLEFLTSDIALFKEPEEGELERYFEQHQARYRDPDLISFRHVFFDPDLRDDSMFSDVAETLSQLQAADDPDAAADRAGDRPVSQSRFYDATQLEVRRQLGSGFAEALIELEPGRWHGPVLSGFGVHLVYIHGIRSALPPNFEDARSSVLEDWQRERQDAFNEEFYQSLKSRYDIVIAEPPAGLVLELPGQNPDGDGNARVETSKDAPAS